MREGWTYKKVGDVCDFYRGLTYSGKDEVEYSHNIVLRSNNVDLDTFSLNLTELKYISEEISIPKDKMLKKGALLMCMSNGSKQHLGKVAFIDEEYPYAFGGFMGQICPREDKIVPKYLYYYCCSPMYKSFLLSIGNGANINNLRFSDLSQNEIPLPPKSQQEAIVSELDEINSLLALKREQLQTYDKLAQSLFYEMFGDPVENEKGWEVKKLGEVCIPKDEILRAAKKYASGDIIQYIDISSIDNKTQKLTGVSTFIYDEAPSRAQQVVQKDDILVSLVRPNLKNVARVKLDYSNLVASSGFCVLRSSDKAVSDYIFMFVISDYCTNYLIGLTSGANYPAVREQDVRNASIPLPPLALQQQFATRIAQIEEQKQQVQAAIERLETLLASRMQYWFD